MESSNNNRCLEILSRIIIPLAMIIQEFTAKRRKTVRKTKRNSKLAIMMKKK